MQNPVNLGLQSFPSKAAAEAHVRAIKDAYEPGSFLSDEDAEVVLAALQRHPDCASKTGCGVRRIGVFANGKTLSGRGFGVERVDGTIARFSYKVCFAAKNRSHADRVREAFRNAVRPFIFRWRENVFQKNGGLVRCDISGALVEVGNCHVDHLDPPFEAILKGFLSNEGLHDKQVDISITDEQPVEAVLSNEGLARRWVSYHNARVKLRILSPEAHRQHHDLV